MATVTRLTASLRRKLYWKRLQYIGPTKPALCKCGAGQQSWKLREGGKTPPIMGHGDHIVAKYKCKCGRPIIIVRELQRVRKGR